MSLGLIMMALGDFRFGVSNDSLQELSKTSRYRWGKVNRTGRKPGLQFLGSDSETITLRGTIFPHYKGGLRQVDLMRKLAGFGVPLPMVDGTGFNWDLWAITSIDDAKTDFLPDGAPRQIKFTISMETYGRDFG